MNEFRYIIIFICILYIGLNNSLAQRTTNGKSYSGKFFKTEDYGECYLTSVADRIVLQRVQNKIDSGLLGLKDVMTDYSVETHDMSFAFDSIQNEELSRTAPNRVKYCLYSYSQDNEYYLTYYHRRYYSMIEESPTYMASYQVSDSVRIVLENIYNLRRSNGNADMREDALKKAMEFYQQEVEKAGADGNFTEAELRRLDSLSKPIKNMGNQLDDAVTYDKDSTHAIQGELYEGQIKLNIVTNEVLMRERYNQYKSMAGNPARYYYKEITIPGFTFACIYFDKYNKTELPYSHRPVFFAYKGSIYENLASTPVEWVKPHCITVTFSGNLRQIYKIYPVINFSPLARVIQP